MEEPEAHQHPRTLWKIAELVWATVTRGVQVVLATHSLELVDALVGTAPEGRLDDLDLRRLALREGAMTAYATRGSEVAELRVRLDEELR